MTRLGMTRLGLVCLVQPLAQRLAAGRIGAKHGIAVIGPAADRTN